MADSGDQVESRNVNSLGYWDHRFETDWSERGGPEQSEFFARLAIEHLPEWFRDLERSESLTICDWGCAQGDGTKRLADELTNALVTGVDFSDSAISAARERHPSVRFVCADYLTSDTVDSYDVLFCSNTLEHFENPRSVLLTVAQLARRMLVVLIPFRESEAEMESEHEVSFDYVDLQVALEGSWSLVHAAAIDASKLPNTRWHGEQILLVYAKDHAAVSLGLSLADTRIAGLAVRRDLERLAAARAAADNQRDAMARDVEAMRAQVGETDARCEELTAEADRIRAEHDALVSECERLDESLRASAATVPGIPAVERAPEPAGTRRATLLVRDTSARLSRVSEELALVHSSRSWRWTAVVRRAVAAVTGMFRRS